MLSSLVFIVGVDAVLLTELIEESFLIFRAVLPLLSMSRLFDRLWQSYPFLLWDYDVSNFQRCQGWICQSWDFSSPIVSPAAWKAEGKGIVSFNSRILPGHGCSFNAFIADASSRFFRVLFLLGILCQKIVGYVGYILGRFSRKSPWRPYPLIIYKSNAILYSCGIIPVLHLK